MIPNSAILPNHTNNAALQNDNMEFSMITSHVSNSLNSSAESTLQNATVDTSTNNTSKPTIPSLCKVGR